MDSVRRVSNGAMTLNGGAKIGTDRQHPNAERGAIAGIEPRRSPRPSRTER
jgi:hypothetical protein